VGDGTGLRRGGYIVKIKITERGWPGHHIVRLLRNGERL